MLTNVRTIHATRMPRALIRLVHLIANVMKVSKEMVSTVKVN
jgi:hypothetical protein